MIEPVTFDIFEPQKRFRITREIVLLATILIMIIFFFIAPEIAKGTIGSLIVVGEFLFIIYIAISSPFLRKPLLGYFDGEIEFTQDAIVFKGSPYYLSEITAINFHFGDYYNQHLLTPPRSLNRRRSQVVDNYVEFTIMNEESYVVYLRCEDEDHHKLLDPFIHECDRWNKLREIK